MKILAIDIETSPNVVYTWGLFDQNVGLNQVISQTEVMCFAAKWLGQRKIHFYSTHHDGKAEMVQAAHDLLSEADVVMHYNGKQFDTKHLHREFLEAGLGPPEPFVELDLLTVVRSKFRFTSHKLQNITVQLGLEGKVAHSGFDLWRRCLDGDESAWRKMKAYNRQDVVLLEELYDMLRPWINNHPNHNLYDGRGGCPSCGSMSLVKRGVRRTSVSTFQRFHCQSCGAYSRSTKRDGSTSIRPGG